MSEPQPDNQTMNSTTVALILNNQALELLRTGKTEDSIETFEKGIAALRVAGQDRSDSADSFLFGRTLFNHDERKRLDHSLLQLPLSMSNDACSGCGFIMNLGVCIETTALSRVMENSHPQTNLTHPGASDLEYSLYSCILLSNLALAYLKHGADYNKTGSLRKATTVYNLALAALENITVQAEVMDSPYLLTENVRILHAFISVQSLNNQANVEFVLCNYDRCHQCLELLTRVVMDSCLTLDDVLGASTIDEVLINTKFLMEPPSAAGAA